MNKSLYTIACFLVCCCFKINATVPDTAICLMIEGVFENAFYKDNRDCNVEIISEGKREGTVILNRFKRKLRYFFAINRYYTLRITKEGFVPLSIDVDTRYLERADAIYHFKFTTRLITEKRARTLNQEALFLPLAVIRYFPEKKNFYYDQEYTESVKWKLVLITAACSHSSRPDRLR